MKKKTLTILLLLLTGIVYAQGIKFEEGLSWDQVKAKAKAEDKFIFMDCYATWCGPCKWMNNNIFSTNDAGNFMNKHFINVAVQIDRTAKDELNIRKWYGDAKAIEKEYSIASLPTYLFFSPDGQIVHRIIGVTGKEVKDFIDKAKEALDPKSQYYSLIKIQSNGKIDSLRLRYQLLKAIEEQDYINASLIADSYLQTIQNPYLKENSVLLYKSLRSTNSLVFKFFLKNIKRLDSIEHDNDFVESQLSYILLDEKFDAFAEEGKPIIFNDLSKELRIKYPFLGEKLIQRAKAKLKNYVIDHEIKSPYFPAGSPVINWDTVENRIASKYPGFDSKELIMDYKRRYYGLKKMWPEFEASMFSYINAYQDKFEDGLANSVAWDVFLYAKDKKLIDFAIKLMSKVVVKATASAEDIDTYANLLYKLGRKNDAILWEKKAIDISSKLSDRYRIKKESIKTLGKMERNEITWTENL